MIETCEYWLHELIKEKYSLTSLIIQIMYIKISGVRNWEKFLYYYCVYDNYFKTKMYRVRSNNNNLFISMIESIRDSFKISSIIFIKYKTIC